MTTFYSIICKFVKGRPPYAILSATIQWIFTFHCTDFIAKYEWPPNSPDLNPLDYHVWGAMLQAFHKLHSKPKTIPDLKSALQQIWHDLPQTTLNKAINDFHKRPNARASAGGGHFEHTIWILYRNILTELCSLFQKKCDEMCVLTCYLSSNSKNSCLVRCERCKFTGWLRLIWHNFVIFRDNWIKFCF